MTRLVASMATTLLLFSLPVCAQDAAPPPSQSLEQINVRDRAAHDDTRPKLDHIMKEVDGAEITVTKKTSITKLDNIPTVVDNNLRDLFAQTPGLFVSEQQTGSQYNLSYRGIGNPQESEFVSVMQDGIPLEGDWVGFPTLYVLPLPQTISQIQLIRGGSSLLYGPEPGPVVNFISRKPDPDREFGGYSENIIGKDGMSGSFNTISGTVSEWDYLFDAHYRTNDGQRDNGGSIVKGADAHIGYRPDDAGYWALDFHGYEFAGGDPGKYGFPVFQRDENFTPTPYNKDWVDRYVLELSNDQHIGGNVEWMTKLWSGYQNQTTRAAGALADVAEPVYPGVTTLQDETFRFTGIDSRVVDHWGRGNALTAGFVAYHSDAPFQQWNDSDIYADRYDRFAPGCATPSSLNCIKLDQRRSTDYAAVFAENVFRFDEWHLVPSVRVERENVDIDESGHTGHSVLVDRSVDHTVPLFGLGFGNDFGHANETYFNVSQGWRPVRYFDTVVTAVGGTPISGATVALGSRITTTDPAGSYIFTSLPAGTYPQITASDPGYVASTVNSVVVTDGGTTTENFALALAPNNGCFVDTTQADFGAGALTNLDSTSSPGDLILTSKTILTDQSEAQTAGSGFALSNTAWVAQMFTAGITGKMSGADVLLFCSGCSGTNPDITVSIRASTASGTTGTPTGSDLAVGTIAGFNDAGAGGYHAVTFTTPLAITAGTQYALVVRSTAARTGVYAYTVTTGNPYVGGRRATSANSGVAWTLPAATSLDFHTFITIPRTYSSAGDFISSTKDSNPALGYASSWLNLAWTAAVPTNTSLQFQVAGSNSIFGPFNFIGPDGTAATFFTTSDPSLSQFNGDRYLKYRAYLATSDTSMTPTLNDVSLCFADLSLSGTSLEFDQEPTNTTAGATMSPAVTVRILDGFGNPVTTDNTSQVTLAVASGPGTLTGGGPVTVVGGTATFSNLVFDTAGTYTLTATSGALASATSTSFVISAGTPSKLAYSQQPSNSVAGQPISPAITVSIEDAFGNVVTSSSASVALAIGTNAGGTGTVLSGGASVAAVNGVATFPAVSINKVGTGYTLVASSTGLTSATSSTFNIIAGAAAKLVFTTQPNNNANVAAGATINLVVQVQDASGNVVTTDTSAVTIAIGNNPGLSTLSGTTTTNAVAGVATFTGLGLSLNKVGTGYTLVASDANSAVTSVTSNAFNIVAGAAASLQFVQQPTDIVAGAIMTPPVTVRIFDANGNPLTTSVTVVTLTIASGPSATLFGGGAVNDSAGLVTYNALSIHTAGTYTLMASASGATSVTSSSFVVSPGALSKLAFSMEPPATTTAGSPFSVTVQLQDQFGNVLTNDSSTAVALALAANPGGDSYAGNSMTASAGVATFSVTLMKVGSGYTLQASAGGKSATSTAFDVTAGSESKLAFVQQPADVQQGMPLGAVSVEVDDGSGNRITSDNSTIVSLSISVCNGSVAVGSQTVSSGLATFPTPASPFDFYTVATGLQLQASGTGLMAATSQSFNVIANPDVVFADGFEGCRP